MIALEAQRTVFDVDFLETHLVEEGQDVLVSPIVAAAGPINGDLTTKRPHMACGLLEVLPHQRPTISVLLKSGFEGSFVAGWVHPVARRTADTREEGPKEHRIIDGVDRISWRNCR